MNADNKMISFVLPIYNMEKYVARCLDSILAQTYKNYEVIMVNDGSSDKSESICEKYLKYDQFSYYAQANAGVSAARNNGLNHAQGDWVCFVDPDDYLKPQFLEILISNIEEQTDIVSCCCMAKDGEKEEKNSFYSEDRVFVDKKELYLELMDVNYKATKTRKTAIGVPWAKLYRASFLKEHKLCFDTELRRMQDNIFNMYAFACAREVAYVDEPLYIYNLDHIGSFLEKYDPKMVRVFSKVVYLRHQFLKQRQLLEDEEIARLFVFEVQKLSNMMLLKYFLHAENKNSLKVKKEELKKQFSGKAYVWAFARKSEIKVNKRRYVRMELLKKRKYTALIIYEKGCQKLASLKGKR